MNGQKPGQQPLEDSVRSKCAFEQHRHQISGLRHRLEVQVLRDSEELLRATLSNATDAVLMTDRAGKFTYVCPNVSAVFGYSQHSVWQHGNISFLLGDDFVAEVGASVDDLLQAGQPGEFERRTHDAFGVSRHLLISVRLVSLQAGTVLYRCRDITERKALEAHVVEQARELQDLTERLCQRDQQYQSLAEKQIEMIACWRADGQLTFVNTEFRRCFEMPVGQTKSFFEVLHKEDAAAVREQIASTDAAFTECRLVTMPGGRLAWQQWIHCGLRDELGNVIEYQSVGRSIDKRVRAERQLEKQQAMLMHASRLSTLGELVAGFVHEIRQPLGSISNFASAISKLLPADGNEEVEQVRDCSHNIVQAVTDANQLVNRFRVFGSRAESESSVDINEVIHDAVELLKFQARDHRVKVVLSLAEMASVAAVDRLQGQQVLVNLLMNAFQALSAYETAVRTVTIMTKPADSSVEVIVSDNGPGVNEDHVASLFEPFQTTHAKGMGLGLTICKTVIDGHGGRIWHQPNTSDGGASFHFTIPLKDNKANP